MKLGEGKIEINAFDFDCNSNKITIPGQQYIDHQKAVVVLSPSNNAESIYYYWKLLSTKEKLYILDNYLFVIELEEGIEPHYTLRIIEKLVQYGCRVHCPAFISQSLKIFFDKKYPNNKFTICQLSDNFHFGIGEQGLIGSIMRKRDDINNPLTWSYKKSLSNDRKYRMKFFSFRHQPQRDLVWMWLRDNNLLDQSNNLFNRRPSDLNIRADGNGYNENYSNMSEYSSLPKLDLKWVMKYFTFHPSQQFDVTDNVHQDTKLYEAHLNTYFDILVETVHPFDKHHWDVIKNQTSLSKRTIFPLLCRNAFHIYPKNAPLENVLQDLGFKLFFQSDADFLNNSTEEFYKSKKVQDKLEHNQILIMNSLIRNWWF